MNVIRLEALRGPLTAYVGGRASASKLNRCSLSLWQPHLTW
jgi:hypothetical protein